MKVSSFSRVNFAATLSILCALHTGPVLAITSPRLLPSHEIHRQEVGSLGVDEEGNLLWCINEGSSEAEVASATSKQPSWSSLLKGIRGGDLCVDGEGNFYSPRQQETSVASTITEKAATPNLPLSPTTEALRGGSHPREAVGQLQVDNEGNLFYSGPTQAADAATNLRGGDLSVDNEGNFYTPRPAAPEETPMVLARRGGGHNDDHDAVVLAKNEGSKKIHPTKNKAPKKTNFGDENPMAFIGFNNALMET